VRTDQRPIRFFVPGQHCPDYRVVISLHSAPLTGGSIPRLGDYFALAQK
jgi:hypothetical protein